MLVIWSSSGPRGVRLFEEAWMELIWSKGCEVV